MIRVKSPDAKIQGFIVRDSGADLTAQNAGIYVEPGSDRVLIHGNDLTYNLFGIWLQGSKDAEVSGNLIVGKRNRPSAQRHPLHELPFQCLGEHCTGADWP